jgi:uracil-DNA glycosylase family 4
LCPRLVSYRAENRAKEPSWHNAPVPSFGVLDAELLIVGLAPGVRGANRTGRPFTGDYAGILLYETLHRFGLASEAASTSCEDGLRLSGARITNAVKCLPPDNKPLPAEVRACNEFLRAELIASPEARVVLALGTVAHAAVLRACGLTPARYRFAHGAEHALGGGRMLVDSYHCSRYNANTRRLTADMFRQVVGRAVKLAA